MPAVPGRPSVRAVLRRGFTLVELLIAVVLVGLLATFALARFQDVKEKAYVAAMKADLHHYALTQEIRFDQAAGYAAAPAEIPGHKFSPDVERLVSTGTPQRWFLSVRHAKTSTTCSLAYGEGGDGLIHCPGWEVDFGVQPVNPQLGGLASFSIDTVLQQLDSLDAEVCPYTGQTQPCPLMRRFQGKLVRWSFGDSSATVEGAPAAMATVTHTYPAVARVYVASLEIITVSDDTLRASRAVFVGVPVQPTALTPPAEARLGGGAAGVATPYTLSGAGAPVSLKASRPKALAGQPVTFQAGSTTTAGGVITSWTWDFGDGSDPVTTSSPTTTHTFTRTGSFPVRITATDTDGQTVTTTVYYTCRPPEVGSLDIAALPAAPTTSDTVTFAPIVTGTSAAIASYGWTFGDGASAVGPVADGIVRHRYPTPGQYVVTLTVTDVDGVGGMTQALMPVTGAGGAAADTTAPADTTPASPNQRPVAAFTVSSNPTVGRAVTFDASGSYDLDGALVRLDWDLGDFATVSMDPRTDGRTTTHTYASVGMRTVRLIATDDRGAADTTTRTVAVADPTVLVDTTGLVGHYYLTDSQKHVRQCSYNNGTTTLYYWCTWYDTRATYLGQTGYPSLNYWNGGWGFDVGGINGKPAIGLGATTNPNQGVSTSRPTGGTGYTVTFVAKPMSYMSGDKNKYPRPERELLWGPASSSTDYRDSTFALRVKGSQWKFYLNGVDQLGGAGPALVGEVPMVITVTGNGTTTQLYMNGVRMTPPDAPYVAPGLFSFGWHQNTNCPPFVGYVGEPMLYNRALAADEQARVEAYLRNNFGF